MKSQFSDGKLDAILKAIVDDARLDDETVGEIADSPQLWWGVQRNISGKRPLPSKGWFPTLAWQAGTFASLALITFACIAFLTRSDEMLTTATVSTYEAFSIGSRAADFDRTEDDTAMPATHYAPKFANRFAAKRTAVPVAGRSAKPAKAIPPAEIKSEFIALMYSQEPESGQLVKVKVPRSMMVSLGVSTNVRNGSEFVNAEVLMGDDGSARAIRFIQ